MCSFSFLLTGYNYHNKNNQESFNVLSTYINLKIPLLKRLHSDDDKTWQLSIKPLV